mmetsp:Transcript_6756/g.15487  ORF Transcript_6756/g.15487 Transcript_6756/m.15487 type:complete len:443 (+) Transcript_6756:654-1982(+)
MICEHHERGDARVEGHGVHVLSHLLHRLVQKLQCLAVHLGFLGARCQGVDFVPEAHDPGHLVHLPRLGGLERSHEHLVEAEGVRSVLARHVVGVHHVAPRLGHLLPVASEDHALVHQLAEGLGVLGETKGEEHFVPEARVEQVQHRVFLTAHVQVNRKPRLVRLSAPCLLAVLRVSEAQVVPAAASPLGHGVGLASEPLAVLLKESPVDGAREAPLRVVAWLVVIHVRQLEREVGLRHCNRLVEQNRVLVPLARIGPRRAINRKVDWDRLAPVPLPGENPVAEFVSDLRRARTLVGYSLGHCFLALGRFEPIKVTAIHRDTHAGEGLLECSIGLVGLGSHHALHGQVHRLGEGEVPLVVAGHSHHSAGAVGAQHVVSHPHRDFLACQRVPGHGASRDARLGLARADGRAIEVTLPSRHLEVGVHGLPVFLGDDRRNERVLWG